MSKKLFGACTNALHKNFSRNPQEAGLYNIDGGMSSKQVKTVAALSAFCFKNVLQKQL